MISEGPWVFVGLPNVVKVKTTFCPTFQCEFNTTTFNQGSNGIITGMECPNCH